MERTGSFRKRELSNEMSARGIEATCEFLDALTRLNARVEYMQIDGWHFLDSAASAAMARQMEDNLQLLDDQYDAEGDSVEPGIRSVYWSSKWVPVFALEHQLICLDLDPAPGGLMGQVIRVSADGDERQVVAESIGDFCSRVYEAFVAGNLSLVDSGAGPELVARDGYELFVW